MRPFKGRVIRDLDEALAALADEDIVAVDLETSGLSPWKDVIAVLSAYGPKSDAACVLHVRGAKQPVVRFFDELLAKDEGRTFIFHNGGGFDLFFLANAGVDISRLEVYDTLLGEAVALRSGRRDHSVSLKAAVKRRMGKELDKGEARSTWMAPVLSDSQVDYCVNDIRLLPQLREEQLARVRGSTQDTALRFEHSVLPAILRMTLNGLPFNPATLRDIMDDLEARAGERIAVLEQYLGPILPPGTKVKKGDTRLNLRSPQQLKAALSAVLGVPLPNTSKETLQEFYLSSEHPALRGLLEFKEADQLLKMYNEEWVARHVVYHPWDGWNWVHARFMQCGTDTGRMSSSDPNLQQVSARWQEGRMRTVFEAPPGHVVVSVDYNQLEIVIAAALARDAAMLEALRSGDVHTAVASQIFHKPQAEVTRMERKLAKACTFTLLFGGGANKLHRAAMLSGTNLSDGEAKELVDQFFATFRGLGRKRRDAFSKADSGYPVTLTLPTGLIRVLVPGAQFIGTQLLNTPVQGTAAAGLKMALRQLHRKTGTRYVGAAVHDELVACCPEDKAEEVATVMQECMMEGMRWALAVDKLEAAGYQVPLGTGTKIGRTWNG